LRGGLESSLENAEFPFPSKALTAKEAIGTTLKDRGKEIGPGLLKAMLDRLGLSREDWDD
jgi:hypothetical protein